MIINEKEAEETNFSNTLKMEKKLLKDAEKFDD